MEKLIAFGFISIPVLFFVLYAVMDSKYKKAVKDNEHVPGTVDEEQVRKYRFWKRFSAGCCIAFLAVIIGIAILLFGVVAFM